MSCPLPSLSSKCELARSTAATEAVRVLLLWVTRGQYCVAETLLLLTGKRSIVEFSTAHTDTPTDYVSSVYLKGDMCAVSTLGQLAEWVAHRFWDAQCCSVNKTRGCSAAVCGWQDTSCVSGCWLYHVTSVGFSAQQSCSGGASPTSSL